MFSKPTQFIQTVHGLMFPVYCPTAGALGKGNGDASGISGRGTDNGSQAMDSSRASSGSSQSSDKS
ncbi:MAG: hypothetical protein WBD20_08320 [Pirellulaceae bacterium]